MITCWFPKYDFQELDIYLRNYLDSCIIPNPLSLKYNCWLVIHNTLLSTTRPHIEMENYFRIRIKNQFRKLNRRHLQLCLKLKLGQITC